MLSFRARGQRGITLIEIILVLAIVAAATVAIFVFSKKASVTAAVETEQRQIEDIVKTVDGLFATQPNFAALGTNGAEYLRSRASRSGLKMTTDADGNPALRTGLGNGDGVITLASAQIDYDTGVGQPDNGFMLAYQNLRSAECIGLVTSTAAYTTKTEVGLGATPPSDTAARMAMRGQLVGDKSLIASACNPRDGVAPSVFLFFAPSRAIASLAPPVSPPAASCAPVTQNQQVPCPVGQVGSLTQERSGACTGPNNSIVYTPWTTTNDTCQAGIVAPPTVTPPAAPDNCVISTFINTVACPAGQTGNITQTRQLDTCAGTYTPWVTTSSSCMFGTAATCTPATATQTIACPAGQGGQIQQTQSSNCPSPTSVPTWSGWTTISSTCTAACVASGTCCTVRREGPQTNAGCPAGQYGDLSREQERFLGCVNATTQAGAWSAWNTISTSGSCSMCPATSTEPSKRWISRDLGCAVGEVGSHTIQIEQVATRTVAYSCPAGTATLPAPSYSAWSSWTDTGLTGADTNTCAPATCTGSSNDSQWIATAGSCPVGQAGDYTWEYEQARSRSCVAGAWGGWSGWSSTGSTRNVVNTCVVSACAGNATESQWSATFAFCPVGQTGDNTWEYEQTRSRTCVAGAWSSWSGWSSTGATRNGINTCVAAACTGSPNGTQWIAVSAACPSGQSGTNTWEYEQARSRSCVAGAWSAWTGWTNTGATRNVVNTCAITVDCRQTTDLSASFFGNAVVFNSVTAERLRYTHIPSSEVYWVCSCKTGYMQQEIGRQPNAAPSFGDETLYHCAGP